MESTNSDSGPVLQGEGGAPERRSRRKFLIVGSVAILSVALALFVRHYCYAHNVPPSELARIEVGMEWAEAKKILGTSDEPVLQADGTYRAGCRKHDRWCMVDVTLDSNLRVTSVFHDH